MNLKHINEQLVDACIANDLNQVEYLLTSKEIKENADIHYNYDEAIVEAAKSEKWDIVKCLLTSPNLHEHANIHSKNDYLLRHAAFNGNLDAVKFLLTSPTLKEHADINSIKEILCDSNIWEWIENYKKIKLELEQVSDNITLKHKNKQKIL